MTTLAVALALAACSGGGTQVSTLYSAKTTSKVYICTGPKSKRYHTNPDCRGLGSCSKAVRAVTIEKAQQMGRTLCGYCSGKHGSDVI